MFRKKTLCFFLCFKMINYACAFSVKRRHRQNPSLACFCETDFTRRKSRQKLLTREARLSVTDPRAQLFFFCRRSRNAPPFKAYCMLQRRSREIYVPFQTSNRSRRRRFRATVLCPASGTGAVAESGGHPWTNCRGEQGFLTVLERVRGLGLMSLVRVNNTGYWNS